MKNPRILVAILVSAVANVAVAQDCATPLPITSQGGAHDVVAGDLCTAANSLPTYGGTASPQNEVVYRFNSGDNPALTIAIAQGSEASWSGQQAAIFLMPSPCSSSTDPVALGFPGNPMGFAGLAGNTDYYLIVTADPGSAAATCGTYTVFVSGILPVELIRFSID